IIPLRFQERIQLYRRIVGISCAKTRKWKKATKAHGNPSKNSSFHKSIRANPQSSRPNATRQICPVELSPSSSKLPTFCWILRASLINSTYAEINLDYCEHAFPDAGDWLFSFFIVAKGSGFGEGQPGIIGSSRN